MLGCLQIAQQKYQFENLASGQIFRFCMVFSDNHLKDEHQPEWRWLCFTFILVCSDTLPARNLFLNSIQFMQYQWYFAAVWFLQQNLIIQYFRRMGRKMVPRVKDNNPLGTLKTVSLCFEEE